METSFGIAHVWQQGDWVTRAVAIALLLMSLASWSVIALKSIALRRLGAQRRGCDGFWHSGSFDQGLQQLGPEAGNPYREVALRGLEATQHLQQGDGARQLHDQLDVSDWVERALQHAIDDGSARLQAGLSVLASVGSTAPFVGLFGTVWGIYHALLGLGAAEQASIAQVAGPIGEALVMTALGLVVAIPAVLGYNALVRANKRELHRVRRFAHELHGYFVTGARIVRAQA